MWLLIYFLATSTFADPIHRCAADANKIAVPTAVNRVVVEAKPHETMGMSAIVYRGRRLDESNLLEGNPDTPYKLQFAWNEQAQVGMILSLTGVAHASLGLRIPDDVQVIAGTRYRAIQYGGLEPENSQTYKQFDGPAIQKRYFDVKLQP